MTDRPTNQTQIEQPINQLNQRTEGSLTLPPRLQTFRNWRLSWETLYLRWKKGSIKSMGT